MEKEKFLKNSKIDLRLFVVRQFILVLIIVFISSIIALISNVLVSFVFIFTVIIFIYMIKMDSYGRFGLYKLLYYSKNSYLLLYLPIISSCIISFLIISNLNQSHLYRMFEVVQSETDFSKMKFTSLSLILPFSLIVSILNYNIFDTRIRDLIDDKIYESEFYFKRIKERYQSPRSLREYLINQSKTPLFWYLSEKHEGDLVNDLFYRGLYE